MYMLTVMYSLLFYMLRVMTNVFELLILGLHVNTAVIISYKRD